MNNKLLIVVLLVILPWGGFGLRNNCMAQSIDSIHVTFTSLGEGPLEIHLMSDRHTLSLFKTEHTPLRLSENVLIYQTHSHDTIDHLFSRIKIILDNPPIYDTSAIIHGYGDGMTVVAFSGGDVKEETYIHNSVAYFPFAYAELYSFIRQIFAKYWRKE